MEGGSERISSAGVNAAKMVRRRKKVRGGRKVCPECGKRGITSRIKLFRINLEESIYLCSNEKCPFPMTCDPASLIIQTNSQIDMSKRTKSKTALTEKPLVPPGAPAVPEIVLDSNFDLDQLFNDISVGDVQDSNVADSTAVTKNPVQPPSAPEVTDIALDSSFDLDQLLNVGSKEDVQDSNVADLAALLDNFASSAADESPCPAPSSNTMLDDLFALPDVSTPPGEVSAEISSAPICDFAASSFSVSSVFNEPRALQDSWTNSSNLIGTSENSAKKDTAALSESLTEPTSVQNSILSSKIPNGFVDTSSKQSDSPLTATNQTSDGNAKQPNFTDYRKRSAAEAPCVTQNQTKQKSSRTGTRKSSRSRVIPPIQKPNESVTKPVTRNAYLSRLLDERARLEAAAMAKKLATNPPSEQSSAPQNGSASQVPVSGIQQANPGIQQVNQGIQQANPGRQQVSQGIQQANPGIQQVNLGIQQANPGIQQTNLGIQQTNPGIQKVNLGIQQVNLESQQVILGIQQANPGRQQANPGRQQVNLGIQKANPGIQQVNLGIQQVNLGIQKANPGIQKANPGIQQSNPGIQQANPGIQQVNLGIQQANPGRQQVIVLAANNLSSLPGIIQLPQSGNVRTITLNQEQFAVIQKQLSLQLNSAGSCPTSNSSPTKIADLSAVIQSASAMSRSVTQDTLTNHALPSFQGAPTANTATRRKPTTNGAKQTGPRKATKRPLSPQPEPTDTRDDQVLDIFSCMAAKPPPPKPIKRRKVTQPKAPCKRKPKCATKPSVVKDATITRVNHWLENQTTGKKQFSGYQPKYLQKAIVQERNASLSDDSGIQSPLSGRSEESTGPRPIR